MAEKYFHMRVDSLGSNGAGVEVNLQAPEETRIFDLLHPTDAYSFDFIGKTRDGKLIYNVFEGKYVAFNPCEDSIAQVSLDENGRLEKFKDLKRKIWINPVCESVAEEITRNKLHGSSTDSF